MWINTRKRCDPHANPDADLACWRCADTWVLDPATIDQVGGHAIEVYRATARQVSAGEPITDAAYQHALTTAAALQQWVRPAMREASEYIREDNAMTVLTHDARWAASCHFTVLLRDIDYLRAPEHQASITEQVRAQAIYQWARDARAMELLIHTGNAHAGGVTMSTFHPSPIALALSTCTAITCALGENAHNSSLSRDDLIYRAHPGPSLPLQRAS